MSRDDWTRQERLRHDSNHELAKRVRYAAGYLRTQLMGWRPPRELHDDLRQTADALEGAAAFIRARI